MIKDLDYSNIWIVLFEKSTNCFLETFRNKRFLKTEFLKELLHAEKLPF